MKGLSWFQFYNLRLALCMILKFYTSVAKVLKLKLKKFLSLTTPFVEVTAKKPFRIELSLCFLGQVFLLLHPDL